MTSASAVAVRLAVLAGAAVAVHWGLGRLGRRLPVVLARRRAAGGADVGRRPGVARVVPVAALLLQAALWLGVAYVASEQHLALRALRERLRSLFDMAVEAPLFTLDGRGYSAIDVVALPLLLVTAWVAASALTRLVQSRLGPAVGSRRGAREAVATLARYGLTLVGAVVILQAWGVDVRSLAIFASVLGLGIGFGLQNLIANFVGGLVIGLERPIQPGDFVNVGGLTGTVERIGARCTELRTLDRVTLLVPNSRFLDAEVVNWSHGDPTSRIHVPVGVAYGSDPERVRGALLEAARSHPEVSRSPRPRVELRGFGESSLDFELLVWTQDPRSQFRLKSELNFRIDACFRRAGVQIPFPQRDLHLRSPDLARLVAAWGRRLLPDDPGGGDDERTAPRSRPADAFGWEDDPGRVWSDVQIAALVARMRGPEGVAIADRRHLLSTYPRCFVGRDAVDWLVHQLTLTRDEAVELGGLLVQRGVLHHVLDEHGFEDGNLYYRFRADETSPETRAASEASKSA